MLKQTKNCEKDTTFDNPRTITREGDMKTSQMVQLLLPAFFIHFFYLPWTFRKHMFAFQNCQNLFWWGPLFGLFLPAKYENCGGERCEIRILSCWNQETCPLRKQKTRFYFVFWVINKSQIFQDNLMIFYDGKV